MRGNPSLKAKVPEAIEEAYETARLDAAIETDLPSETFPATCPWTFDEAMRETAEDA
jgi:hypothetical protein